VSVFDWDSSDGHVEVEMTFQFRRGREETELSDVIFDEVDGRKESVFEFSHPETRHDDGITIHLFPEMKESPDREVVTYLVDYSFDVQSDLFFEFFQVGGEMG